MNKVDAILKWIRETDVTTLPYNILSVGWGPKEKGGERTGEYGLIFTVNEKKLIQELTPEQIIPDSLNILLNDVNDVANLVTVKTDVQQVVMHQAYGVSTLCHTRSNTVDPVMQHRVKRRPLVGGIESICRNPTGTSGSATLGIFVKDNTDGQIVALSNNHVYGASQFVAALKTNNTLNRSTTLNLSGYQPSGHYFTSAQSDFIGMSKRAVLFGNAGLSGPYVQSSCDAAILELKDYTLIDSVSSLGLLGFNQPGPYAFATDAEIDSLAPGGSNSGAPIFRSGRTSGAIGFPGNTFSCKLSVYQFNPAVVGYTPYPSTVNDCFYVEGNVSPGAPGDSGSALLALFNKDNPSLSAWKVVGLLFAGPADSSYCIGCRITTVARDLNISSWDGKIPTYTSKRTITTLNNTNSNTVTLSGRTFYQAGFESSTI